MSRTVSTSDDILDSMTARITYERVRDFQPPWRTVQVVTCDCGAVTRWRPSGGIGLRRTPAGHLVAIRATFPGYCAACAERQVTR